ncbi:MAG: argininosuccinate lyase [Gammaproteobacteria bacterium]|nr:argininosuccinate lyase [Gammaproteobacteria bacterium]
MSANNTPKLGTGGLLRGRFSEATDEFVEAFTASVTFDRRLYRQDIAGSVAHAQMLAKIGVITAVEADQIIRGLNTIESEIESGNFNWQIALEDVHMNIESRLIELIGNTGKKLHTGRSRNDQVATDIRLYLRDAIDQLDQLETELLKAIAGVAYQHTDTIMPGFTHLQAAQPITFGHHLMAWFEMLMRDRTRLRDCRKRVNQLPLGAAALAGTPFCPDRAFVAQMLGFDSVCENSLDAVSDRDFAIEFCACAALTLMHMSRWCEELVLWSSQQFDFVELPDRFCTGSSIMPQKKNPDVPELIRGKTGRVNGHLMALLTLMKSQPLAYNKDNQEDKEPLFDSIDTLHGCLTALIGLVPNINPNKSAMLDATLKGFTTATDLADYLVRKQVPFRDAHEMVGQAVQVAVAKGKPLDELTLAELNGQENGIITEDVYEVLSLQGSVAARNHFGGTAPEQVREAIARAMKRLES